MISNKEIDYIQFGDARKRVFWPGTTALEVYEKSVMFHIFLKTCTLILRTCALYLGRRRGQGEGGEGGRFVRKSQRKKEVLEGRFADRFRKPRLREHSEKNLQEGLEKLGCKDCLEGLEKEKHARGSFQQLEVNTKQNRLQNRRRF